MRSSFRRTVNGIKNQCAFYKVDLIFFVEGGKIQFNKDCAYSDRYNKDTEDILFWSKIFQTFPVDKKIKYKSIGSKTTIKEIAQDIISKKIDNVFVAMDSEFDELFERQLSHSQIFYTHGYSWENDVWNAPVVIDILKDLTASDIDHCEIEKNISSFFENVAIGVFADGYLFESGNSFFPRKKGRLFCVNWNEEDLPSINENEIESRLESKQLEISTLDSFGREHSIEVDKLCYGHLLADYCTQLILRYLKNRHSLNSISKEVISRLAISKFFSHHFSNGHSYVYYENLIKVKVA